MPSCLDGGGAAPGFYHRANVAYADEFLKEWGEKLVSYAQVMVGFDEISQVKSVVACGLLAHGCQVTTEALLVFLRRILGSRHAAGREAVVITSHLRVSELDRKSTRLNSSHANISYAV